MSIVVYAQITTERTDGYLTKEIVRDLAKLSRREKGCIQYDLMAKENGYIVFEEWEDTPTIQVVTLYPGASPDVVTLISGD